MPSPTGEAALRSACRAAPPDVLPATPYLVASVRAGTGRGTASDGVMWLRMGFEAVAFDVTQADLETASGLGERDPGRWGLVPLARTPGVHVLSLAARGDPACGLFEAEVAAQEGSGPLDGGDAADWWRSSRFPNRADGSRGWCIATHPAAPGFRAGASYELQLAERRVGEAMLAVLTQTVTGADGALLARRTRPILSRTSFPIGVTSVQTGCSGDVMPQEPELVGQQGVAVRPASAPDLKDAVMR